MEDLGDSIYQLKNPFNYDFTFEWDSKTYVVPAGKSRMFIKGLAEHGAYKISEAMIRKNEGDAAVLQKALFAKYTAQVLSLVQATDTSDESSEDEEDLTPDDLKEITKEVQVNKAAEEEQGAFASLNSEEVNESERLEAMKENNPQAARAEELNMKKNKQEVMALAKSLGVDFDPQEKKALIIEKIVKAEFDL